MSFKCNKCGADIPEGASFCPGCGSPAKEKQQAPQQPVYNTMRTSGFKDSVSPLENIFKIVFSKTAIILVIGLGILFAWIGMLIMMFASESFKIAFLFSSMGYAAIGLFLTGGGIWNSRIDKFVRLAMVLIGVYLVVHSLSVVGIVSGLSGIFGRSF